MDYWLLWKLIKYTGLMIFSGSLGALVTQKGQTENQWKAVTWGMGCGLLILWTGGYGMVKATGFNLFSPWILYGQFFSVACTYFATLRACGRSPAVSLSLSIAALTLAVAGMILQEYIMYILHGGAALIVAGGIYLQFQDNNNQGDYGKQTWFRFVAWAEGISLLALLFLYMPLKYGASINLDNGQGWFGWMHGLLQILFILSLCGLKAAKILSTRQVLTGLIASLLPFGTMIFERKTKVS